MRDLILIICLVLTVPDIFGQVPGYYNGTEGKSGQELKKALHDIIDEHVDFSYSDAKYILNYADEDPENKDNLILFYTKRSQSKDSWGSGPDDANREHIWAKSHGNFADIRPMDGDAFNLHPADASVNITKSNYDFDECSVTGTFIPEAGAWYTSNQFEPSDAAKGEVARTIFYMAIRYEGTDGEIDLEAVDAVGTYPLPEHGKLSTLLEWNREFPPTDQERRRNDRVYQSQRNRNPFIDNPGFADLIWGDTQPGEPSISNLTMKPVYPVAGSVPEISAYVPGAVTVTLYYGKNRDSEEYTSVMDASADTWTGQPDLNNFNPGDRIYYKIVAEGNASQNTIRGNFVLPENKTLTPISQVQGTGNSTPVNGETVTIGGKVTANFDNTFYMQVGTDPRNGVCVFDSRRGKIGDSIVVTGKVTEYNNLTELDNVSYVYNYGVQNPVIPPEITIDQANEEYESMLVKFRNVTFLEGDTEIPYDEQTNLNLTDGEETIDVYVRYNSRLGGKIVPAGIVNVTAIVSQYQGIYQLLINEIEDIQSGDDDAPPLIGNVIVNDANWIEVQFSEKLDKASAENTGNYSLDGGVSITGVYLYNNTSVLLLVSGLQATDYTLTVTGVEDLQGNAITSAVYNFESEYSSGVTVEEIHGFIYRIYPNPAQDFINIYFISKEAEPISVEVRDVLGRTLVMRNDIYSGYPLRIVSREFEPGIYLITLSTSKGDIQRRLLKE